MNFNMACETVELEDDIVTKTVPVRDDAARAHETPRPPAWRGRYGTPSKRRRGGGSGQRTEVSQRRQKALDHTRTMGVAFPCIVLEVASRPLTTGENEIEISGIHGEPGIEVREMMTADEIADLILEKIFEDMPSGARSVRDGQRPRRDAQEELCCIPACSGAEKRHLHSHAAPRRSPFQAEMAGMSVTIIELDDELERCSGRRPSRPSAPREHRLRREGITICL